MEFKPGDIFRLGGHEWVIAVPEQKVLEHGGRESFQFHMIDRENRTRFYDHAELTDLAGFGCYEAGPGFYEGNLK